MEKSIEDKIKDRYVQLRRMYHPCYVPRDDKVGIDWDRAAQIVRRIGADPALYVDAHFAYASENSVDKFPWPKQLHTGSSEDIYIKHVQDVGSDPENKLEEQNRMLACHVAGKLSLQAIDMALSSPILPFKSWFRILMCSDRNFHLFRRVWGDAASRQMTTDKTLFDFLKKRYGARTDRLL